MSNKWVIKKQAEPTLGNDARIVEGDEPRTCTHESETTDYGKGNLPAIQWDYRFFLNVHRQLGVRGSRLQKHTGKNG